MGEKRTTRRTYLKVTGVAAGIGLAGGPGYVGAVRGLQQDIPMGSILPITGELEAYGAGMEDAVNLAVEHANEAGGPLGAEITIHNRDSETRPEAGVDRYAGLVAEQNIVGFVGAASSGVSAPIAEVVADDRVMMVSPASTSPIFADLGWVGDLKYFGRTAPNDAQQGVVMARTMDDYLEADTAGFLYIDNPYGEGLASVAEENFEGETVSSVGYDPEATDFTSTLDALFEPDPDAIGFIGYPGEGETIMIQWDEGGYGGEWVLSEGLNDPEFIAGLSDQLEGFYLTTPDPEETVGAEAFEETFPRDEVTLFAPHSYDALFLQALAMHAGGEPTGEAIAANILDVANEPGEEVTVGEFDRAVELLDDGEEIKYIGASSPIEMTENVENLNQFAILQISDGETESLETIPSEEFEGLID
ncbi:ABC transporter substrate-binding protein [Natronobeatus ordinarius]|uniref:ABC transporter substrate-binding protein n=1 Tax=Natronobeatus ordinarius TaxID=2963433 RepID=UPI0020CE5523|nr:ABC transporter substrate-binding protein [Natronobeatus ordinarius]